MRVLCVCSAGLLRSPTTASVLNQHFGYNTRAAGIVKDYALIPVDEVLLHWADLVVFMEEEHKHLAEYLFGELPENVVLNIPDRFKYGDATLVALIKERFSAYVQERNNKNDK